MRAGSLLMAMTVLVLVQWESVGDSDPERAGVSREASRIIPDYRVACASIVLGRLATAMLLVVQLFPAGASGCSGEAGLAERVVDRGGERARLALRDAAIEADDDVGTGAWQVDVEHPEGKR